MKAREVMKSIFDILPQLRNKYFDETDVLPCSSLINYSYNQTEEEEEEEEEEVEEEVEEINDNTCHNHGVDHIILLNEIEIPSWLIQLASSEKAFKRNILAQIINIRDLQLVGWNIDRLAINNDLKSKIASSSPYIVHAGFGNDLLESVSRTILVVPNSLQVYVFIKHPLDNHEKL